MNFKIELLLLVVACAGYAVTQEDIDLSEPLNSTSTASTTTVESTSSSTASTTTSTTASTTTSTTASTTTSTTASTTTSTAASTSTKTSPPTSAETTASTQHTEGPASTPKPVDFWAVKNNNGSYCILLKASFLIDFKYKNTQNQTVTSTVNLVHSNHTSVEGSCDKDKHKQSIEIRFFSNWTLTLSFEKSNDKSYYQSEVRLVWDLKEAQIKDAPALWGDDRNNAAMFNTSKTGYLCLARMTLFNNASVENGLLSIYTEQLKLEAFQEKSEPPAFSDQYERCKEDTISNLVPIIVGACLGGLIIIVLVAYLIGRKRSRRGYESV